VRGTHKEYEGMLRAWRDAPDPGEDYNCRCCTIAGCEMDSQYNRKLISEKVQTRRHFWYKNRL
jgi:uncharacterized protein with gpF-like domain